LACYRELPDGRWDERLRVQVCQEFLNLSLALVPGRVQDFPVVVWSKVSNKKTNRRQVHRTLFEHLKNDRELPDYPGGFDAPVGGVLGEVELLRAICEQRGIAFGQVEASLVKLRKVSNERRCRLAFAVG